MAESTSAPSPKGPSASNFATTGAIALQTLRSEPGVPVRRWSSRAHTLDEIERELGKLWAGPPGAVPAGEDAERHVAARTSVLNLVVIARRPEIGQRAAAAISELTGRHPSRTMILLPRDPDGPSGLDATIEAYCVVPSEQAAETCAELIHLSAGGEAGRHLEALVAPLLIHDLPVTMWWPSEPIFGTSQSERLIAMSDRLVVDSSGWSGSGMARLAELARIAPRVTICDFAAIRQSRWREAIASTFDLPEFLPFLRSIRRIAVTYSTHDQDGDPEGTNIVKPIYHVAWLASRLGMHVDRGLHPAPRSRRPVTRPTTRPTGSGPRTVPGGFDAMLRDHRSGEVSVVLRPVLFGVPAGTTLRVELLADRRGQELRIDVTAEADYVHVGVWLNGVEMVQRHFSAPRLTEVDLLAETIELGGPDPVASAALTMARALIAGPPEPVHHENEPGGDR